MPNPFRSAPRRSSNLFPSLLALALPILLGVCPAAECQVHGSTDPKPRATFSEAKDPAAPKPAVSPQGIGAALNIEAEAVPVTEAIREEWKKVIDAACSNVNQLPRANPGRWERRDAVAVLRAIDSTLIRHGFVYPDTGAVDLLAHALSPFEMPPARRPAFEAQPHNQRRRAMIAERFPGPFFSLDCDTACLLYLAVAERLNLPLRLVLVPSHNRRAGHAFIRWRDGRRHVNWETNEGRVVDDAEYIRAWEIQRPEIRAGAALADLDADELLACAHHRVAIRQERRGDADSALRHLTLARQLAPRNLDVRRQLAWLAASTPGQRWRTPAEAIEDAEYVVDLSDDADARDTLAAALAAAGRFDEAVKQARTAIRSSGDDALARRGYRQRLRLYELRKPFQTPRANPSP